MFENRLHRILFFCSVILLVFEWKSSKAFQTTQKPPKNPNSPVEKINLVGHPKEKSIKPLSLPKWKSSDYPEAEPCQPEKCKLPDCHCSGRNIPGNLKSKDVPQTILITFDDSVNDVNWFFYHELFGSNRTNPNGCPIQGTFYVSHEWTDYSCVQRLHSDGNEIASHSISHSNGENFTLQRWWREIEGERRILSALGNVPLQDIQGMRAPFLQPGGDRQFAVLHKSGFAYDATLTTGDPSMWPYTLDYLVTGRCRLSPCPNRSFKGIWEVPLAMLVGSDNRPCSMADSCAYPKTAEGVADVFWKNFLVHYDGNRAPLGLYFHYAWFTQPHHRAGLLLFVDKVLREKRDAYFVTTSQALQWIRHPVPVAQVASWDGWKCNGPVVDGARSAKVCSKPTTCILRFRHHERYVRTCAPCPEHYPWYDNISGE